MRVNNRQDSLPVSGLLGQPNDLVGDGEPLLGGIHHDTPPNAAERRVGQRRLITQSGDDLNRFPREGLHSSSRRQIYLLPQASQQPGPERAVLLRQAIEGLAKYPLSTVSS